MGSEARNKYLIQSRGQYGLLLGGRNEIYASSQAIIDSPILGHGSWAKDRKYVLILLELRRAGYQIEDNILKSDLIPTHSHFFGAWVEAGIMGALFWAWVLLLVVRIVTSLYLVRDPLVPLIVFLAINMLWDVLFSPYGHDRRIISDFSLVVLLFARDVLLAGRLMGKEASRHESVHRHDLVQPGSVS
jgi:O-antigen ligase